MNQDHLAHVIQLSLCINDLEKALAQKKAELAKLAGRDHVKAAVAKPKRAAIAPEDQRRPAKQVNVSQEVLDYLARKPLGRNAVEIINDLELGPRAAAVRSALKKHGQAGRLINTQGVWMVPPKKKEGPTGVVEPSWDMSDVRH